MDVTVDYINYRLNKIKKTAVIDSLARLDKKDIVIPETLIVDGINYLVKGIARKAFHLAQIDTFIAPFSLEEIGEYAFWGSSIKSFIRTGNGCPLHVSNYAFAECKKLERVAFNGPVTLESCAFENASTLRVLDSENIQGILRVFTFRGCCALKDFDFSNSLIYIQIGAFENVELDWANFTNCVNLNFHESFLDALKSAKIYCLETNNVFCDFAYHGYSVIPECDDLLPF